MKRLKLSAVALALMASGVASAVDIEHTCTTQTGCNYSFFSPSGDVSKDAIWQLMTRKDNSKDRVNDIQYLGNKDQTSLKVTLQARHYQNIADEFSGKNEDGSLTAYRLFSIWSPPTPAELIIPTGTTMTLSAAEDSSNILELQNTIATIEKGVTLTIDPSYSQLSHADDDDSLEQEAIMVKGKDGVVTTSADIFLNADNTIGLGASDGAQILASNHNITMQAYGSAVDAQSNSTVTLDNVNISSDSENTTAIYAEEYAKVKVKNSTINLAEGTGVNLVGATVNLDNTTLKAKYAVIADTTGYFDSDDVPTIIKNNEMNITNSNITGTTSLFSQILTDDLQSSSPTDYQAKLNAENSTLYGKIATFDGEGYYADTEGQIDPTLPHTVLVNLTKNSKWTLNGDSQLHSLSINDSSVFFESGTDFKTLTINQNLVGNNSTFRLNTDLANQKSDQIIVNGEAQGSYKLEVKDSGNEPQAANGKVTLVKTQSGDAIFSLLNRDYVDAGAYRYRLVKQGNDWLLSNNANEQSVNTPTEITKPTDTASIPVTPTETAKAVETPTSSVSSTTTTAASSSTTTAASTTTTATTTTIAASQQTNSRPAEVASQQKMLSQTTNAQASLRQAQLLLVEQNLNGVHQRLSELNSGEKGSVWLRNQNGRYQFEGTATSDNSHLSGFKQDYHSVQLGSDVSIGKLNVGGLVGTSSSTIKFSGDYGRGSVKSQFGGVYAALNLASGFYWDNLYKYERSTLSADTIDKQHYYAHTLSTEIGQRMQFANDWTFTPQAQFAWTQISGKENVEKLTALYSRLGAKVGKILHFNQWVVQPYAEINGIFSKNNHSHININGYLFDVASSRSRLETTLGISAGIASHHLALQISQATGSRVDQSFAAQVMYSYNW